MFSYWPVISLGANASMNFELSLPLIWLVLFDLLVTVMLVRRRKFWRGIFKHWVWLLLPLWLSASVLWSLNSLRGLLTVGVLWLVYLAGYGFFSLKSLFEEVGFREKFWKMFFGSAAVVCVWCLVQCVLDLCGVSREMSLMCAGCTYGMFGFSHPNGFAIEPQFMGNLLLAPAMVAAWVWVGKQGSNNLERKRSRGVDLTTGQAGSARYFSTGSSPVPVVESTTGSRFLCSKLLLPCFFTLVATLFLTFSRGAIYAFGVGMVVMTIWMGVRQKTWRVLKVWGVIAGAFVLALVGQGVMAEVSPTNDTFRSGVTKVVNHLSLGVIEIGDGAEPEEVLEANVESVGAEEDAEVTEAVFDGYVAESTDTRLRLSGAALEVWRQDFATVMFGVGLGGAGQALYVNGLSPAPKEIVQNQYASLLLESGLVGVILLILTLVLAVRAVWKSSGRVVILSLLTAYGVSVCFFSGLPNALHIYLLPALFANMSFVKNKP